MPLEFYEERLKAKEAELKTLSSRKDSKKEKEISRINTISRFLKTDMNEQTKNNGEIMKFLNDNLSRYFEAIPDEAGVSAFLVQHCIYPRLMLSPADALYAINFVKLLVSLRVPKINVLNIFA